jgi:hypothetical protein
MNPAPPRFSGRRQCLAGLALTAAATAIGPACRRASAPTFRLATFEADVTVPPGHGMMGGAWLSKSVADPLEARGIVLLGGAAPVVFVAVDWCEIRNDSLDRWKEVLAAAAGTTPERVMVVAIHQHDAPVADLGAERILRAKGLAGTICDPDFHETAVQRVAASLQTSLGRTRPVSHLGLGQARVDRLASNRRYVLPDGSIRFDRTSATRLPEAVAADVGTIDPWLRTLSFWNGNDPVAALSTYAVHPMSYYGQGEVSADFPGLARRRRQAETPGVHQIYFSGCSGNVTAGKFNTGDRENRQALADRLHAAMTEAWHQTQRHPLTKADFRVSRVRLEPRSSQGFSVADLEQKLVRGAAPFHQCLAALGLHWRQRVDAGHHIDVPALDLGPAQLVVLPGETYVEFQLAAQAMRPDQTILTAGYGEGATGYIPTERHIAEHDPNLGDWCWVAPGSEPRLLAGIAHALGAATRSPGTAAETR